MYLSFRRSQHALLALSFFVVMVLVVFSTLLWVYSIGKIVWSTDIGGSVTLLKEEPGMKH